MVNEDDTGLDAVNCCVATKDALIVCVPKAKVEMLRVAVPVPSKEGRPISLPPSAKEIIPEVTGAPAAAAVACKTTLSPSTPLAGMFTATVTGFDFAPPRLPTGAEPPNFPATNNEQVWFAGK